MNIKKFFIIVCITMHFSEFVCASSQDSWNAAFNAFGGINGLTENSLTFTNALSAAKSLNNGNGTPESLAIGRWTSTTKKDRFLSNFTNQDVQTALNIANGGTSSTGTSSTNGPTATDTAAATLKAQIEAAQRVYNLYEPGTYSVAAAA